VDTFFCRDGVDSRPRLCTEVEAKVCVRAADGALPDRATCLHAGVPWKSHFCPPGFEVDGDAAVGPGELPRCKAAETDCGVDPYGDAALVDGAGIVFVSAATGKDTHPGTRSAPLRTIAAGLAKVPAAGTVAVAAGTYNEVLKVERPVALRGRCAAMVELVGVAGKVGVPALLIDGKASSSPVKVAGLRVSGPRIGVGVHGALRVELRRILISHATYGGIVLAGAGAMVTASEMVIEATRSRPPDKQFGVGVAAGKGATLELRDVRLRRNRMAGILVMQQGKITADRVLVDATQPREDNDTAGHGAMVTASAHLELRATRLFGNRAVGLWAQGAAAEVSAEGLLVDGTLPQAGKGGLGRGVDIEGRAHVLLRGARLSANRDAGLYASQADTTLIAHGLIVDGTLARESGEMGRGVELYSGVSAELRSVRLSANRDTGLRVSNEGTMLVATDVVIDATLPRASDDELGIGAVIMSGAHARIRAARLSANRAVGLGIAKAAATASVIGLLVDGTEGALATGKFGRGVEAQSGASGALWGARLLRNREVGLAVAVAGSGVTAAGLVIEATRVEKGSGDSGLGALVFNAADMTLISSRVVRNRGAAIAVSSATLTARNTVAATTLPGLLARLEGIRSTGELIEIGDGVSLHAAGTSRLEDCLIVGSARVGVLVDGSPKVAVRRTVIDGAGISTYGMALQDSEGAVDEGNAVFGAAGADRVGDVGLALPAPPGTVPL